MSGALLLLALPAWALDVDGAASGATTGDPTAFSRIGQPGAGDAGDWDVGLLLDYADDPLAEVLPSGRAPVVDALGTARLTGAYSFGLLRLDGALPVHVGADTAGTFLATGDTRIGAQMAVPGIDGVALHVAGFLPTGADAHYVGGTPRMLAEAIGGRELGPVGVAATVGLEVAVPQTTRNVTSAAGPVLGLGAAYRVNPLLSVGLELSAQGPWAGAAVPVEATLSGRARLPSGLWATAGAAAGVTDGIGAARWRLLAGFGYSARPHAAALDAAARAQVESELDRDGDHIVDRLDVCPDQPETVDGITDDDGCPELDGDGDGVPFGRDACPTEPILPEQDPRTSDGCPHPVAPDYITIPDVVFFREGRSTLLPSAIPVLTSVRDTMLAHPEMPLFLIEGHANTNGPDAYNLRLSDARAWTVLRWLVAHGVDPARLMSKGYGEARPMQGQDPAQALIVNRRVEFRVLKVEGIPEDARHLDVPADVK